MKPKELLELKSKIETAKNKVAGLKGKKEALLDSLHTNYGCNGIKEAEEKVNELSEEVEELQDKIEDGVKKLKSKYNL